ncbi:MAG: EamA family transporter [Candidatus Thorarchaeota archaeon]
MAIIDFLGEIAAICGAVCFGIGNVIIKSQGNRIKPFAINMIRLTFSAIFYLILIASMGIFTETFTSLNWQSALLFAGGTLTGVVVGDMIFYFSQQLIGLSRAYPIAASYPLLTYIIGLIIGYEEFAVLRIIGVILVIIGVYFVSPVSSKKAKNNKKINNTSMTEDDRSSNEIGKLSVEESNVKLENKCEISEPNILLNKNEISTKQLLLGLFGAIATAILWTAGTIMMDRAFLFYVSPVNQSIASIPAGAYRIIVIAPISWGIFLIADRGKFKSKFTWKGILLVLLAGIIGNTAGGLLYVFALQYADPSTTAAITASAPLVATPLSIIFLKEKISWKLILGTILTIGGIWLIILKPF